MTENDEEKLAGFPISMLVLKGLAGLFVSAMSAWLNLASKKNV